MVCLSELIVTVGLPGSGKSSWAEALRREDSDVVVVCRDDIRWMLHDYKFTKRNEKLTWRVRDAAIQEALTAGRRVVVADTNLSGRVREHLRLLAEEFGVKFTVNDSFLSVSVHECIKRDLKRVHSVGADVILRMYGQHLASVEPLAQPVGPSALIVDVDGTLALNEAGRSPYDYSRVAEDTPNAPVVDVVRSFHDAGDKILVISGRDDECAPQTRGWLELHNVPFDELIMRATGDTRRDSVVKKEIFENHVRDRYNVRFVLDDRTQVVQECWRPLGLTCFQVADGNF